MGHQHGDVPVLAAETRHRTRRTVGIRFWRQVSLFVAVAKENPIFVVEPISSALNLAIYGVYKFRDPSRLLRNAL